MADDAEITTEGVAGSPADAADDEVSVDDEDDGQGCLFDEVFERFLKLVIFARVGNGTLRDGDQLVSFHIEFPAENDLDVRVRFNDEECFWSHPRAARPMEAGDVLRPEDVLVERLPLPEQPAERFIRGVWLGDRWNLEVHLSRPHPRRSEHLAAAVEFVHAAELMLGRGLLRPFYESAYHAAEHLAQAELLSYPPSAELVATARTHQTVRSTYALWAKLGNTDPRFAKLLDTLEDRRSAATYVRGVFHATPVDAEGDLAVLREMLDWVTAVREGRGPEVIHLVAHREIEAGRLVGVDDLGLRPAKGKRSA